MGTANHGFTLIEVLIVLGIFTLMSVGGVWISLNDYSQVLNFFNREPALDELIEKRATDPASISLFDSQVSSTTMFSSGIFSQPLTLYENGELQYEAE